MAQSKADITEFTVHIIKWYLVSHNDAHERILFNLVGDKLILCMYLILVHRIASMGATIAIADYIAGYYQNVSQYTMI